MGEVCGAFLRRKFAECFGDFAPQAGDGAGRCLAQEGFEFGEDLFDGIEVGRLGRQIAHMRARCFDGILDASDFMAGQVVHDDDLARLEGWHQKLLDPGAECLAIHRAVQRQRRTEPIAAQGCDKCGGAPMAIWCLAQKPLSGRTAAVAPHHVGGKPGLVDEHQSGSIEERLFTAQGFACSLDVRPVLFAGVKSFF